MPRNNPILAIGSKVNRWTIVAKQACTRKATCRCECGVIKDVYLSNISSGKSKSCGCWQEESRPFNRLVHGMSGTRTFKIWAGMWSRCTNPRATSFKRYGAKGVTVCPEWGTFQTFFEDMGIAPEGSTLDRIDSTRGYSKDNCRWATYTEQSRNRSVVRKYNFEGQQLYRWEIAKLTGFSKTKIFSITHSENSRRSVLASETTPARQDSPRQ
jgi:hypothetical protein